MGNLALKAKKSRLYNRGMETSLEKQLGEALRDRGWTIAFAESCTGGLVGHRMTNIPGSSDYYLGSVTAYAYNAKEHLLGVEAATLEQHGAVSETTVLEMATGIRNALGADLGISISGIAGPGGGTTEKPVGLVWIGISSSVEIKAKRFNFAGGRLEVKQQAADEALRMALEALKAD